MEFYEYGDAIQLRKHRHDQHEDQSSGSLKFSLSVTGCPPLLDLGTTAMFSAVSFIFSIISHKQNQLVHILLHLTYFTYNDVSEICA